MKSVVDAKKTMLLHSEAKVEFFKKYLQRYLRILYLSPYIGEINIFDVFCGTGIYDNGKKGSPIVTFESIVDLRNEHDFAKPINLIVNDSKAEKIETVRGHIDQRNQNHCTVTYRNLPANEMFEYIGRVINGQTTNVRNLIFIDPYGYKEIKKDTLEALLSNHRTEIILFLPISQMQRFTTFAVTSDDKPYEALKEFVESFFSDDHPIKHQTVPPLEYIEFVKDALKFGQYYATSYYIERDDSNYYALFFISYKIYGFEKILEVKWELDEDSGGGFKQPQMQEGLFDEQNKDLQRSDNYDRLKNILKEFLKVPRTNKELYEVILKNEFLPKHAGEILREWQDKNSFIQIIDPVSKEALRKGSFYINWDSYNPSKNTPPKALFILNSINS